MNIKKLLNTISHHDNYQLKILNSVLDINNKVAIRSESGLTIREKEMDLSSVLYYDVEH